VGERVGGGDEDGRVEEEREGDDDEVVPCAHGEVGRLVVVVASCAVGRMNRYWVRVFLARCCCGCCARLRQIRKEPAGSGYCESHPVKVLPLTPYRPALAFAVAGAVASVDVVGTFAVRNRSCCTGRSNRRSCKLVADPSVVASPFADGGGDVVGTKLAGVPAVDSSYVEGGTNCGGTLASRRPCIACASGQGQSHPRACSDPLGHLEQGVEFPPYCCPLRRDLS